MITKPKIVERKYWFRLSDMADLPKAKVTTGIIHHTASANDSTAEHTNRYHMNSQGWAGIGYHFIIRMNGSIEEGRPLNKEGVHTSYHNHYTVAISLNGNFQNTKPTKAQMDSLIHLCAWLETYYPNLKTWKRHKDLRATACPGKNFPWTQFLKDLKAFDETPTKDVWRVVIDGKQVIALTGKDKALGYAKQQKGEDIYIQNTVTNEKIVVKTKAKAPEIDYEKTLVRIIVNGTQKLALTGITKAEKHARATFTGKIVLQSAVNSKTLKEFTIDPPKPKKVLKVGSKVKVKKGARDYDRNLKLNSGVYTKTYNVIQINGNRVVIGVGKAVTTAIHKNNLILV